VLDETAVGYNADILADTKGFGITHASEELATAGPKPAIVFHAKVGMTVGRERKREGRRIDDSALNEFD
jgi:hypothetical protein